MLGWDLISINYLYRGTASTGVGDIMQTDVTSRYVTR